MKVDNSIHVYPHHRHFFPNLFGCVKFDKVNRTTFVFVKVLTMFLNILSKLSCSIFHISLFLNSLSLLIVSFYWCVKYQSICIFMLNVLWSIVNQDITIHCICRFLTSSKCAVHNNTGSTYLSIHWFLS